MAPWPANSMGTIIHVHVPIHHSSKPQMPTFEWYNPSERRSRYDYKPSLSLPSDPIPIDPSPTHIRLNERASLTARKQPHLFNHSSYVDLVVNVLRLPQELLLNVVIAAARARGMKRAMRLRLVCKTFSNLFKGALFTTDLLDHHFAKQCRYEYQEPGSKARGRSYCEILQQYITYRTLCPSKERPHPPNSALIRGTAEAYSRLAGASDDVSFQECGTVTASPESEDHQQNVLIACVCMNSIPVGRQALSTWLPSSPPDVLALASSYRYQWSASYQHRGLRCYFDRDGSLFACPSAIATQLGRLEILQLFPERDPEPYTGCNMLALGQGGSLDTFEVLIRFQPPSEYSESDPAIRRSWISFLRRNSDPRLYDRGYEIYRQFPRSIANWITDTATMGETVYFAARNGSVELLRHLFDLGVPANPQTTLEPPNMTWRIDWKVLSVAARNDHLDVVKLLLEKDTDLDHIAHESALPTAAAAGSLDIVRVLLDHRTADGGADVGAHWAIMHACFIMPYERHQAIISAVRLEHVARFDLLVQKGGLTEEFWDAAMVAAVRDGPDSMVDMLNEIRSKLRAVWNSLGARPSICSMVFMGVGRPQCAIASFQNRSSSTTQ
ncbi:hypothetical protein BJ170DRAFT_717635 [Xylariales sp. AK1849]|nr:hypothetical protein BJ170DRAFT_717635 [Xylariales sp. AK1849]